VAIAEGAHFRGSVDMQRKGQPQAAKPAQGAPAQAAQAQQATPQPAQRVGA